MSKAKHETIADIVAALRAVAYIQTAESPRDVLEFANRIEAAAKREREATREKSSQVGNAAKMREALRQVSRVAVEMTRKTVTGEPEDRKTVDEWALRLCDIVSAALAAPPRNCDIGTAEEQDAMHSKWCRRYGIDGDMEVACAHQDMSCTLCALRWAQMPYEEGGAK